ncbi:MAG: zinc-dependent alcohol dehydrogenase family protein, partial [Candidatus Aminicenantes bacterium]|nr:zinc-dependent alcohol dehydrogenase family protein [Candidatus Aminicenantes bacterium]
MNAMVLEEYRPVAERPLRMHDLPVPDPGPGEILLWVEYCGVCRTDVHLVEGELGEARLPIVPGHEVVGIVVKSGEGAGERFSVGTKAGAAWLYAACGSCEFCLSGRENLCRLARYTGFHVNGGYAEYMVVPEAFAYRIPDSFRSLQAAPLLCAGIIGYRALRMSGAKAGGCLGLYGFGASAHIAIQIAKAWGCKVQVVTRSEEHRRLALKLGAAWAGAPGEAPPARNTSAVVFTPAGPSVLEALANAEKGGTVSLAGISMTPIPEMDYQKHLYWEKTLVSVANATRADGEELFKLAADLPIRTTTKAFAFKDANAALIEVKEGRVNGAAVLKLG